VGDDGSNELDSKEDEELFLTKRFKRNLICIVTMTKPQAQV